MFCVEVTEHLIFTIKMDPVDQLLFNATTPEAEEEFLRYIATNPDLIWTWSSNTNRDYQLLHDRMVDRLFGGSIPWPSSPSYDVYQKINRRIANSYFNGRQIGLVIQPRSLVEELIRWNRNPQLLLGLRDIVMESFTHSRRTRASEALRDAFMFPSLYELLMKKSNGLDYVKVLHDIVDLDIVKMIGLLSIIEQDQRRLSRRELTLERIANPREFQNRPFQDFIEYESPLGEEEKFAMLEYLIQIANLTQLRDLDELNMIKDPELQVLVQKRIRRLERLETMSDVFEGEERRSQRYSRSLLVPELYDDQLPVFGRQSEISKRSYFDDDIDFPLST